MPASWNDSSSLACLHTVVNTSDAPLAVVWMDYSGRPTTYYKHLKPGRELWLDTWTTHTWELRSQSGEVLARYAGPSALLSVRDGGVRVEPTAVSRSSSMGGCSDDAASSDLAPCSSSSSLGSRSPRSSAGGCIPKHAKLALWRSSQDFSLTVGRHANVTGRSHWCSGWHGGYILYRTRSCYRLLAGLDRAFNAGLMPAGRSQGLALHLLFEEYDDYVYALRCWRPKGEERFEPADDWQFTEASVHKSACTHRVVAVRRAGTGGERVAQSAHALMQRLRGSKREAEDNWEDTVAWVAGSLLAQH